MSFWAMYLCFSVCAVMGYGLAILTVADKLNRLEELEEELAKIKAKKRVSKS